MNLTRLTNILTLRASLRLFRSHLFLVPAQIALALLLFLLFDLWLHIPDASLLNLAESVLLATLFLAIAGGAESWLILRLANTPRTRARLLRGALFILLGALLYVAWTTLFHGPHPDDFTRAGYLNSRFPRSLRTLFSFEHIALWQQWLRSTVVWIGTGIIAAAVVSFTAAAQPARAILSTLRSLTFWIALILGSLAATAFTGWIVNWTIGHGLRTEMLSLILRLAAAALVDATIATLILCILAVRLLNAEDDIPASPE